MLTPEEFEAYGLRLNFLPQAKKLVETIRSATPSRRVQGNRNNVCARYPSRKMGQTIQAESHTVELAAIYEKEYDRLTYEFYDQPPPFKISYRAKNGKIVGFWYTADFFVLQDSGAGWEEWKAEEELAKLCERMPNRYQKAEPGGWRCPPGEAYAATYGLFYRVRTSAEIDWNLQNNLRFLEDYLREDCPTVSESIAAIVRELLEQKPGLFLAELLETAEGATCDEIYTLIARGAIYVDWRAARLSKPDQVKVYRDPASACAYRFMTENPPPPTPGAPTYVQLEPGAALVWSGQVWQIGGLDGTDLLLLTDGGKSLTVKRALCEALVREGKITGLRPDKPTALDQATLERLSRARPEHLAEANRRFQTIEPILRGQITPAQAEAPLRSVQRWLADYHQAEQTHPLRYGYLGLLPRRKGNGQPRFPAAVYELAREVIDREYKDARQKKKNVVYGALLTECEQRHLPAPSYKTFARILQELPQHKLEQARQGRRAAYAHQPFVFELEPTTPPHGERPFAIAHIDHTLLDVELVSRRTQRNLGRPWLTLMIDAFDRRILALYLTFDPPSYRSCMMVIRECVHRHGRIPDTLVVDWGADFESVYFETLLAAYERTKKSRPKGKPRFGSVIERLFGTTNTQLIHNLLGNTQIMKKARQVTQVVNPKHLAVWTLGLLYLALSEWAYEIYETTAHPALGMSPREAFAQGTAQSGERAHRLIPYDQAFQIFTLPTTRTGRAKVQLTGIRVNYIAYWAEEMRHLIGTQVDVRFDPFDLSLAYAYLNGQWIQCRSEYAHVFKGHSQRELMLVTQEIHKQHHDHSKGQALTAKRLADYLTSLKSAETLLQQRLCDAEAQDVLNLIHGTALPLSQLVPLPESQPPAADPVAPAPQPEGQSPSSETGKGSIDLQIYEDL